MNTIDIDAFWNKPVKIEGSLGDDGDYPVTFVNPETRFVKDGTSAVIEFPFAVNEGESQGEKGKVTIFYINDDEPDLKGLERLKAVSDLVDPSLRETMKFNESLAALQSLMHGRTGMVNQNTWNGRVYFRILQIDPAAPPVPTIKQSKGSELLTESDIPF